MRNKTTFNLSEALVITPSWNANGYRHLSLGMEAIMKEKSRTIEENLN